MGGGIRDIGDQVAKDKRKIEKYTHCPQGQNRKING
jgi:hypothetical protein